MNPTVFLPADEVYSLSETYAHNCCCGMCGSQDRTDFFAVRNLPAHVCLLGTTPTEARQTTRGDILLSFCHACGLISNRAFDPERLRFEPEYEASLAYSTTFTSFLQQLAERLIEKYQLRNKHIVEVGCGDGFFLRLLCELGANHGVGFDTSVPSQIHEPAGSGSVRLIREYYTEKHAAVPCDFLCCLSVMEDLINPLEFVHSLRQIVGERNVTGYFEVFNAMRAFEAEETWSVHYEQCNYFSQDAFTRLFRSGGFEVLQSGTCYAQDQYLYVETATTERPAKVRPTSPERLALPPAIERFARCHQDKLAYWNDKLEQSAGDNRRAVVWGTGGKGVSFLNMLPSYETIEYVVDINPRRQGRFIPGSGQQIVAPEALIDYRPDLVILSNAVYEQEICAQLAAMNLRCDVEVM